MNWESCLHVSCLFSWATATFQDGSSPVATVPNRSCCMFHLYVALDSNGRRLR